MNKELEELFKDLDETIFDAALRSRLSSIFEGVIATKVSELDEAYKEKEKTLLEQTKISNDAWQETKETEYKEKIVAVTESIEKYLNEAKTEFFNENKAEYVKEEAVIKAADIHLANKAMLESYFVNVTKLEESAKSESVVAKIKDDYNSLKKENDALQEKLILTLKESAIKESCEGLSEIEKEKVMKNIVDFQVKKESDLEVLKENIKSIKEKLIVENEQPKQTQIKDGIELSASEPLGEEIPTAKKLSTKEQILENAKKYM